MGKLSLDNLFDIILEEPSIILFIGPRGSGKSFSSTYFLEEMAEDGWRNIVLDMRGEDKGIHKPNIFFAQLLYKYGLEPKGYPARFFTFRWPDAMWLVPEHYLLAPISLKMIYPEDLKMLTPTVDERDVKLLGEAIAAAGGHRRATMEGLIQELTAMSNKVSYRLIRFLASGIIDDTSPLEPDKLLKGEEQFTVISVGFSEVRSVPVQLWAFKEVTLSILDYVATHLIFDRIMVWFREITNIAPRSGGQRPEWHTNYLLKHMINMYRELSGTQTRIGIESQYSRLLPTFFHSQARLLFVSPFTLRVSKEFGDIESHYGEIPEEITSRWMRRKDIFRPGFFFAITKDGDYAPLQIPPPRSFRPPQSKRKDEVARIQKIIERTIPFRKIDDEINEMEARFIELRSIIKGDIETMPPPPKEPSRVRIDVSRIPLYILIPVYFAYLMASLEDSGEGSVVIWRPDLIPEVREFGSDVLMYLHPSKIDRMLQVPKNRRFLRNVGFNIYKKDGDFLFELTRRFLDVYGPQIAQQVSDAGGISEIVKGRSKYARAE